MKALLVLFVLAGCKFKPMCASQDAHVEKFNCREEWTIDLQPQADGTIIDFSRYETVCDRRCVR